MATSALFDVDDAWDFLKTMGEGTIVWGVSPEPGREVVTHRRVVGHPRTIDNRFFGGIRSLGETEKMLRHALDNRYGLLFLPGTAHLGLMWCDIDDPSVAGSRWDTPPAGVPHPTWVTNTGGGQHLLWALGAPLGVDSDQRHRESVRALAARLGGDRAVSNGTAQRLRLPGSTNFPNAKKLAAGRVPVRVTFARQPGEEMLVFDIGAFPTGSTTEALPPAPQLSLVDIGAELLPIAASDVASIDALARFVDAKDRSTAAMAAMWALARGRNPEQVRRVLLEPGDLSGHRELAAYVSSKTTKWLSRSLTKVFASKVT